MKCHQRQIREAKAAEPLPDEAERRTAATFDNASIREILVEEARPIILDYEWLGNMGTTRYAIGLYFKDYLAGVACFGNTAGSMVNRSICGAEYSTKVLALAARGRLTRLLSPNKMSGSASSSRQLMSGLKLGTVSLRERLVVPCLTLTS
jgi:hypothetical protein